MSKLQSSSVFVKYPADCGFGGKRVLNLGCGFAKYPSPNVVNLDAFGNCKPDVVWNLSETPLPFKDEEFDFIIANHILEHVPNWWACFEECARILKPGGRLEIWVPGPGSDSVTGYRDHINTINNCSWFGTHGYERAPTNAWATADAGRYSGKMALKRQMSHMERFWWARVMPTFLLEWCATHLRNIVFEVGFFFERLA